MADSFTKKNEITVENIDGQTKTSIALQVSDFLLDSIQLIATAVVSTSMRVSQIEKIPQQKVLEAMIMGINEFQKSIQNNEQDYTFYTQDEEGEEE